MKKIGAFLVVLVVMLSGCSTAVMNLGNASSKAFDVAASFADQPEIRSSTELPSDVYVELSVGQDGFVHAMSDGVNYRINGLHEGTLLWTTRDDYGTVVEYDLIDTVNRYGPVTGTWIRGKDSDGNPCVRVFKFSEDISLNP